MIALLQDHMHVQEGAVAMEAQDHLHAPGNSESLSGVTLCKSENSCKRMAKVA